MQEKSFSIILEKTSHPGNIGASARAMKTMGLEDLRLVNCVEHNHSDTWAMASGADNVVTKAACYSSIQQAASDCQLLIGLSGRVRSDSAMPVVQSSALHSLLHRYPEHQRIGFLFGNEKNGLDNNDLSLCHYQLIIPTNPEFKSLNLAASVQLISYLCHTYQQSGTSDEPYVSTDTIAPQQNIDALTTKIIEIVRLTSTSHKEIDTNNLKYFVRKTIARRHPSLKESDMLQGLLKRILKTLNT